MYWPREVERPFTDKASGQVGADDRDALQHALEDQQARAGQLIVGQRVAEQPLEQPLDQPQREQHDPDQPVDLARLAGTGPGGAQIFVPSPSARASSPSACSS
jgi:hypothetical protein